MFDRYTDRARKAIGLARQEAERLNHDYLGTEHILLGLIKEGTGTATIVLRNLHVDLDQVRAEVENMLDVRPNVRRSEQIQFHPATKAVLEAAMAEANALDHNSVGTEHLLLGVLKARESVAATVLARFGLDVAKVRAEVLDFLSGKGPEMVPLDMDDVVLTVSSVRMTYRACLLMAFALAVCRVQKQKVVDINHFLIACFSGEKELMEKLLPGGAAEAEVVRKRILQIFEKTKTA